MGCVSLLLFPCSSNSHLTKESSAFKQQRQDPGLFSIFQGYRIPVLVSFLLLLLFVVFKPGSSALVPAWSWVESVAAAGEGVPGCLWHSLLPISPRRRAQLCTGGWGGRGTVE